MNKLILIGELLFIMCFSIACENKIGTPITDIKISEIKTNDNILDDKEKQELSVSDNQSMEPGIEEDGKDSPDAAYVDRMTFVNDKISLAMNSELFQKGDLEARRQLIIEVLETLIKDQYLKNYTLYTEGENPRVEITYLGGGTGFVMLDDFAKDQN